MGLFDESQSIDIWSRIGKKHGDDKPAVATKAKIGDPCNKPSCAGHYRIPYWVLSSCDCDDCVRDRQKPICDSCGKPE